MAKFNPGMEVGTADLAAILGRTDRWIRDLENQGVLQKTARGRYKLAASVQAYVEWRLKAEVDRRYDESDARQQIEIERARKLRLQNDEAENKLVPTDLGIAAVDFIVGILRTDLAGVPALITEDVALRRRAEDAIDQVLNSVADRFEKASAALEQGRDPLEADEALDA